MRTRDQIRAHCEKLYRDTDPTSRGFKLFMVEIELLLDCRDYLATIAKDAQRRNIEAAGKLPPKEETKISVDSHVKL